MTRTTEHPTWWLQFGETMVEGDLQGMLDGDDSRLHQQDLPELLGILPLRNTVLYPGIVMPITVARDKSIELLKDVANKKEKLIGVVAQRNGNLEDVTSEGLHRVGVAAQLLRLIRMPDGSVTIVIQGRRRFQIDQIVETDPYFKARVTPYDEVMPSEDEARALTMTLKQEARRIIELSPNIPSQANVLISNINSLHYLVHFIASNLQMDVEEKQALLEKPTLHEKATLLLEQMTRELQVLQISEEIQSKVRTDLEKQQRDYILRQQIKAIYDELGDSTPELDIETLRTRGEVMNWPDHARETFLKELSKLRALNPNSPEYGVSLTYLQWLLDLPWQTYSEETIVLKNAQKVLNRDHYGLEKVKERILEYLAVLKLKGNLKSPILCFVGPPGVGKTSLGKSVAEALGRSFVRMSLGGVRDEAEIRGHRRTYIGSLPGRIIQGLKKAKTSNPVFLLDEVDKMASDFRGDPASALLEVLDPEQNSTFSDHYLELEYDLSKVLFIATANSLETLHPALLDRMEIIEISGYTRDEKVQIAKTYLVPRTIKDHGLKPAQLKLDDKLLQAIIEGYTREAGVRALSQRLATISRRRAKEVVEGTYKTSRITLETLDKYLGVKRYEKESALAAERPGVAIGLAWTAVGGEILYIETALMPGKGRLSLTGQLGEVMKESAHVAHMYLKANAHLLNIDPQTFDRYDVHIHIPAGAIPKDGPSAGITLLTALASVYTRRRVKPGIALSGEITLRGKVLPVGGIREKTLAAARAGIHTVLLSRENKKDVLEMKDDGIKDVEFVYLERMEDVFTLTLEEHPYDRLPDPLPTPSETSAQAVPSVIAPTATA
jgi:ATP-dependent Lon protease